MGNLCRLYLKLRPGESLQLHRGWIFQFLPHSILPDCSRFWLLETIPGDIAGIFNKTGRGYPDVSTQGSNFEIVVGGEVTLEGGTSASSPTLASIIALINDRLLAENKPVLEFLNPFIYSKASSAFTEVTTGHNSGFVCPASSASLVH
jgi:tripeptidyl-peptidase-1